MGRSQSTIALTSNIVEENRLRIPVLWNRSHFGLFCVHLVPLLQFFSVFFSFSAPPFARTRLHPAPLPSCGVILQLAVPNSRWSSARSCNADMQTRCKEPDLRRPAVRAYSKMEHTWFAAASYVIWDTQWHSALARFTRFCYSFVHSRSFLVSLPICKTQTR